MDDAFAAAAKHVDLRRIYKNFDEHPKPTRLPTQGSIPKWVEGVFLRVGPAYYDLDEGFSVNHWFDGFALLQNFIVKNGEVLYRSKYLQSEAFRKALEYKRTVFTELGTRAYPDPCKNIFSRFVSHFTIPDITDNDMVNIYQAQDAVFAATEGHLVHRIDPVTLATGERVDLSKIVSVNLATAHPHHEADGTMYNLGTSFTGVNYHIVKFPPVRNNHILSEGEYGLLDGGSVLCRLPFSWNTYFSYYHSFAMTEKYIIFLEQPLLINTLKLALVPIKGRSLTDCFEWHPEEKTRFYIIDKSTGEVWKTKFQSEPFFFFHTINSYEEDGHIVLDIITYPSSQIIDDLFLARLRQDIKPTCLPQAKRFVLPLVPNVKLVKDDGNLVTLKYTEAKARRIEDGVIFLEPENLGPEGFELPQINQRHYGARKYRYFYATGLSYPAAFLNKVVKMDVQTKEYLTWSGCDHTIIGEPVFVPHPDAKDEDDGIVMAIVLELTDIHNDFLVFLDARTMTEIARSELQSITLPPLLHGAFFDNVPLDKALDP